MKRRDLFAVVGGLLAAASATAFPSKKEGVQRQYLFSRLKTAAPPKDPNLGKPRKVYLLFPLMANPETLEQTLRNLPEMGHLSAADALPKVALAAVVDGFSKPAIDGPLSPEGKKIRPFLLARRVSSLAELRKEDIFMMEEADGSPVTLNGRHYLICLEDPYKTEDDVDIVNSDEATDYLRNLWHTDPSAAPIIHV